METVFRFTVPLWGEPPMTGGFPLHRAGSTGFDIFFDVNKPSNFRWFGTLWRSLLRHCSANGLAPRCVSLRIPLPLSIRTCAACYSVAHYPPLVWYLTRPADEQTRPRSRPDHHQGSDSEAQGSAYWYVSSALSRTLLLALHYWDQGIILCGMQLLVGHFEKKCHISINLLKIIEMVSCFVVNPDLVDGLAPLRAKHGDEQDRVCVVAFMMQLNLNCVTNIID